MVVVLLLVIVPGLTYLLGWAVMRYTGEPPGWVGFPVHQVPRGTPPGTPPANVED